MEYKSLKKIYYTNQEEYEKEYQNRLNSYGTIRTNMFPYLMKKEEFASSSFPLFSLPLLEIQYMSQQIVEHTEHSQRSIKRALKELEEKAIIYKVAKRPIKHSIIEDYFDYKK